MFSNILRQLVSGAAIAAAVSGCMHPIKPSVPRPSTSSQLPTVLVDQIYVAQNNNVAVQSVSGPTPVAKPERTITVTASNADVRELLPAIAAAGGINIIMSPAVTGRVSVRFVDVPVSVALNSIIEQAGLSVGSEKLEAPWAPVVFHGTPVNVNVASAHLIAARFGVSERLAKVIVESRGTIDKN